MGYLYLGRLKVDDCNIKEVVGQLAEKINHPTHSSIFITYLNAYVFCLAYGNHKLKEIINYASLVVADGISIKNAALINKGKVISRCIMTKVFDEFIKSEFIRPCKAILIGATEPEVIKASKNINKISKNIVIIESFHGYYDEISLLEIAKKHEKIDIVLIGMGSPKSEFSSQLVAKICPTAIVWHIGGGTIKCYAGAKRRAPEWISKFGIEWLHRFIFERETRKRYLVYNPLFVIIIVLQFLKSIIRKMKP
jgi:N-acetylglucosaminyldiphosphoundecaprenol N-acetyl-beta-D-mannosaminyltransferase